MFPETALRAQASLQNFTLYPRRYYVDILKRCRKCHRPFIFYAREQQYWFEELGFFVNADCVACPECRHSERHLRSRFKRYSVHVARTNLTDQELETLVGDALFLYEVGVLRDGQTLRRLRNLARRRISSRAVTRKIDQKMPGHQCRKDDRG